MEFYNPIDLLNDKIINDFGGYVNAHAHLDRAFTVTEADFMNLNVENHLFKKWQIIDDIKKVTLLSVSSVEKDIKSLKKSNKSDLSKIVAEKLAKKAQEKKITNIYFDRGVYKYHGRVKVFAEVLRKNGMKL